MEPTQENFRAWDAVRAAPAPAIPEAVRRLLPNLVGRHVLQLPCGTGEAAAELVALGALVTALDADADLLERARRRAPTAVFVRGDPGALPAELQRGRMDVVYATTGIRDHAALAAQAWTALRPGGALLVHDAHPVAACVDLPSQRWRSDYFEEGRVTVASLLTAIAAAGFRIVDLAESPAAARRVPGTLVVQAAKG